MKRDLIDWVGRCLARLSPTLASHYWYFYCFRRPLSLTNPVTLNEKLQWLKLKRYGKDPLVIQCADKYRVREYVEKAGFGHTLNPLLGVWEKASDIPWESLPEAFVLKCNHGCGYNLLCPDKSRLDIPTARKTLEGWMNTEFWENLAEIHYRSIPKRIIAEAYLGDALLDYKIYCFQGKAQFLLVCAQRDAGKPKFYFFDRDWKLCPLTRDGKEAPEGFTLPRPERLEEMLQCAESLAAPFPFVRVDLYHVDGRIVFGELTFTPSGALDASRLPETDRMFGDMLHIPH